MDAEDGSPADTLSAFLQALVEDGRVTASLDPDPAAVACDDLDSRLEAMDAAFRLDAPDDAPPLDLMAARFGAVTLHAACRFLLDRRVSAEMVKATLTTPKAIEPTAAATWSVDLCLRYLHDVFVHARGLAPGDPLVEALIGLASAWPLSGVGVPVVRAGGDDLPECLRSDRSLKMLLVDRIVQRGDRQLASIPWIREAMEAAAGAWPELLRSVERSCDG